MMTAVLVLVSLSIGACLGFVAFALCAIQKGSAAPVSSPSDAGGGRGRFDILPDRSAPVSALPPASPPRATGWGGTDLYEVLNSDYRSAESVAITIDDRRVWVEVNGVNAFRAYNVGMIQVDDRRGT